MLKMGSFSLLCIMLLHKIIEIQSIYQGLKESTDFLGPKADIENDGLYLVPKQMLGYRHNH